MTMTEYPTRRLFTNAEYQLAQRAWDREGMDDPTFDAPPVPESDEPEDALAFPPLACQCGAMSIQGVDADELTKQWVAADRLDHHLGRPCGTKLWSL